MGHQLAEFEEDAVQGGVHWRRAEDKVADGVLLAVENRARCRRILLGELLLELHQTKADLPAQAIVGARIDEPLLLERGDAVAALEHLALLCVERRRLRVGDERLGVVAREQRLLLLGVAVENDGDDVADRLAEHALVFGVDDAHVGRLHRGRDHHVAGIHVEDVVADQPLAEGRALLAQLLEEVELVQKSRSCIF